MSTLFDFILVGNQMANIAFTTSNAVSVKENLKTVMAVAATTDGAVPLSYSISGGADAAGFAMDSANGILRFNNTPNFEAPADVNGDNVYEITVDATDGTTVATQTITVAVTNIDDMAEKVESLAADTALKIVNVELATNILSTNKADKAALELAEQSILALGNRADTLENRVDVPGSVSEAIAAGVAQLRSDILNGVEVEYDTLKEVADQFAQNGDLIETLQNVGAGAIRFDVVQVISAAQQARARLNMDAASQAEFQEHLSQVGDNETFDPAGTFAAGMAARRNALLALSPEDREAALKADGLL